jgi:hypothetical protein
LAAVNADSPYDIDYGISLERFEGVYRATPRRWLVRKLIRKIRRGGSIWGLPGQGKGLVVIMIAIALLNGFEIDGRKTEKVDRILYVDGEDDAAEIGNRVVAACAAWSALLGRNVPVPSDNQFAYVNVAIDDIHEPNTARAFRERVNEVGAGVVIYDALQSVFGGNQNTGEVGGYVWAWIQKTAIEGDHVPLALDHSGWQGKHEAGTVQKRGRVGQSIQVAKRSEGEDEDGNDWQIIDLYMRKSNYQVSKGEDVPILSVRFTFAKAPCLIDGQHDEPDDCMGPTLIEFVGAPEPATATLSLIVEVLEDRGETTEANLAEILDKSVDAIRMTVAREQKRGNADAKRIKSAKSPKRYYLETPMRSPGRGRNHFHT